MTRRRRSNPARPLPTWKVGSVALVVATSLLAGCGASGGDDATATTETTAEDPGGTTSTAGSEAPDDPAEGAGGGGAVDLDALEAVLPDAADIGPGFTVSDEEDEDDDEDDSESDRAMDEACPDAAEYFAQIGGDDDDDDDGDELKRTYVHTDSRQVEITIDPEGLSDLPDIDRAAALFNECGEIVFEEDGNTTRMTLRAQVDEETVEKALVLDIRVEVTSAALPAPIDVDLRGMLFLVDQVGVSVMMIDGLDEETMQAIDADFDRLEELAAQMEADVGEALGG